MLVYNYANVMSTTTVIIPIFAGLCYCPNDCNYMCDPQPQLTDIYANGDSLHIEWTTPANQNHDVYFVEYIEIDHPDNIIDADCSTLTRNYSSSIGITSGSVSIAFQNVSSNSVYLFRIAHHSGEYTTRTSYCFTFEYNMNVPMYEKEGKKVLLEVYTIIILYYNVLFCAIFNCRQCSQCSQW